MLPGIPSRRSALPDSVGAIALIALLYAFANAAAVLRLQQYFAPASIGPYATLALLAMIAAGWMALWRRWAWRASGSELLFFAIASSAWLAACVAMIHFYPRLDACALAYAGGNDRDDALDAATRSLLAFKHPYATAYAKEACNIHLGPGGSPFSPMPGALVLAAPFVLLLGAGAWQNLFWSLAWIAVLRDLFGGWRRAAGLVVLTILSPQVFAAEFVTGGDLFAYTLQALVSSYLVWRARGRGLVPSAALPALLGVALSTRPHMIVVLPMLFLLLARTEGPRPALLKVGVASVAWIAVTLPFAFLDPASFDPMHAGRVVDAFDVLLPHARWWLAGLMGVLLLAFALRGLRDFESFCVATGIVLLSAAVFLTVMESILEGRVELLRFSWYGLAGWTFVATGLWNRATSQPAEALRNP
jgi:hypothetical protein